MSFDCLTTQRWGKYLEYLNSYLAYFSPPLLESLSKSPQLTEMLTLWLRMYLTVKPGTARCKPNQAPNQAQSNANPTKHQTRHSQMRTQPSTKPGTARCKTRAHTLPAALSRASLEVLIGRLFSSSKNQATKVSQTSLSIFDSLSSTLRGKRNPPRSADGISWHYVLHVQRLWHSHPPDFPMTSVIAAYWENFL